MATKKQSKLNISTKPYFDKSGFSLYHSDCVEFLKNMPGESVDMIFADPPYNLSNDGFSVHAGRRVSVNKGDWDKSEGFEEDFNFHVEWIEACKRVLKPNGTIWISGTYHSVYQCGAALQMLGYHILNDIAWYKPNAAPNLSCRYFTASHETLLWARKDKKAKHPFNYQKMKDWENNYTMKCECKCENCKKKCKNEIEVIDKKGKQMRSVWPIVTPKKDEKKFGKHPTQKPLELLDRVVIASTNKGDVVLDPFTGSSTTGLAAYAHGRKFIGIDTEKKFLNLSKKRFNDIFKK